MGKIESTGGHIKIMLVIEITTIEINRRHYWILCTYKDYQTEIRIMLIIEMAKIELIGGHIGFMLIIEIVKIESTGGHIKICLL